MTRTHTASGATAGSTASAPGIARGVDDDVGRRDEREQVGIVGPVDDHDRALPGVPRREPGRVGATRIARGRLGPHHLGPEIGEDAPGHDGRLAGQVDDPQALQEWSRHVVPSPDARVVGSPGFP